VERFIASHACINLCSMMFGLRKCLEEFARWSLYGFLLVGFPFSLQVLEIRIK